MTTSNSKRRNPVREINSVVELGFGSREEAEKQTPAEVKVALKSFGVDTEGGWQSLQAQIGAARGKVTLAAAREDRIRSQSAAPKSPGVIATAQALIDEIKGMLTISGGQVAVFARKAESMPLKDLESLRDQLIRTAARAAKKPRNEG